MPKLPISVTLDSENLTWLKGRVGATGVRSVSELLDRLVRAARTGAGIGPSRSVVGTIDIDSSDPLLTTADAAVSAVFEASLGRPLVARQERAVYATRRSGKRGPAGKRRG